MLLNKHIDKESIENLYESSNILASRYNTVSQKLAIIFKGGRQYLYHDVKRTDYNEFESASSQGKVLNSKIKNYKVDRIEELVDTTTILEQINFLKNK